MAMMTLVVDADVEQGVCVLVGLLICVVHVVDKKCASKCS